MKKPLLFILTVITLSITKVHGQDTLDQDKILDMYQNQRYTEAAAYLQTIYKEDTEDAGELSQLAYANMMAGKLPAAEKNYLKLYALQPTSLPTLFSLASISAMRGIDGKAKAYYQEILKIDSTNFQVYKQLGSLSKGNLHTDKIKYLKQANVLNPTDTEVAFNLSEIYVEMNLFGEADKVLQPALAADSANLKLLSIKMPVDMAKKKYTESIATGLELMSYGDSSTFVMNNLAKSYFAKLDYQNALKYFLTIKDKSVDNEALLYHIGSSYRGLKDYKAAAPYFEKAIEEGISTKIASYYGLLGDSYEEVNKNEEANAAYKRGLLFENNGSLLYNIALVYERKLNDKKNAISYYEQYLKTIDGKKQARLVVFIKNKIADLKK